MRKLNLLLRLLFLTLLVVLNSCSDNPVNPVQTDTHYFELLQNYPNPFNESTTISFVISQTSFVNLKIFNSEGNEITTLVNQSRNAGFYSVKVNGAGLSGGTYFYTLNILTDSATYYFKKQMVLIK